MISAAARSVVEAHLASCWACNELVIEAAAALREGTRPLASIGRPPASRLPAGSRVGRYQILDRVGRGGMGEVYAAYHPDLDRRIALKVVHESGAAAADRQARLLREARAIARLSHPNVVAVYDAGTVADRVFVAMEFVEGHDHRPLARREHGEAGGRSSGCSSPRGAGWRRRTRPAWCTATSSPRTS